MNESEQHFTKFMESLSIELVAAQFALEAWRGQHLDLLLSSDSEDPVFAEGKRLLNDYRLKQQQFAQYLAIANKG